MAQKNIVAEDSNRIACKLVYLLKRYTDEWIDQRLCCGQNLDFNTSHLPLFMSIGHNGISNNKLADKLNVSKQASSKIIKELEAVLLVQTEKSETDARVILIHLTPQGEKFYSHIKNQILDLEEQYKKEVGAKNYELAIDVMLKLIDFHERQNCLV